MNDDQEVIDFSSSLYLNMRHLPAQIGHWRSLSTGKPAAMFESDLARRMGTQLAELQGLESGVLSKSTHQLFWDLLQIMAGKQVSLFRDAQLYPVAEAGLAAMVRAGRKIFTFPSATVDVLRKLLRQNAATGTRPLILTEGWLPYLARPAPLDRYLELAEYYNGLLIVDDTQAFGILGYAPHPHMPLGYGGGGTIPYLGLPPSGHLICVSSLAKGFGIPVAVMSGSAGWIRYFKQRSAGRVHHSPPSAAEVWAVYNALRTNRLYGYRLRAQLLAKIRYFQDRLRALGIAYKGGAFPLQMIRSLPHRQAVRWYRSLKEQGIHSLLLAGESRMDPQLAFIIHLGVSTQDIDRTMRAVEHLKTKNIFKV